MTTKRRFIKHLPFVLASLALGLGVFVSVDGFKSNKESEETTAYYTPSTHYEVSDTASELANYYSSISDSDTGTSLLNKLQTLNSNKRKRTMGYSAIGTDTGGAVIYTDYDLNNTATDSNGQTYGTKVASFYTKTSATSWNREHMWPNSHGGNNVEADILHTRPTISSENSSRGNSFYVEGKNNSSSGWDPYTAGYEEYCRGECARIILYCVVAYPNFTLSDADSHSTSNSNKDNMMGNMNTLIKWHFNYLPNIYEKHRNDGAEYLQGNRNPFVDHPEYVARIWSNFNSTVSNLCSSNSSTYSNWVPGNYCNYGSNTPVQPSVGVTISSSTASVNVGSTTTLSATSTDGGAISWTTSNSSVARLSSSSSASGANITITGVAAGTATITAKATINSTLYSKTCTVTVTTSGGSSGGDEDYTLVTSNSSLSNGDKVVIATQESTPNGVTGWNNSKDATVSTSTESWMQYTVGSASSNGFTLKDGTANSYIASPDGNEFKYGSAGTVSVDTDGHCICNSRYLTKNGSYFRFYTSIGSYTPFYIYKVNASSPTPSITLSSISVSGQKTSFTVGDSFSFGGTVTAHFSDSSTSNVTSSATFSGYNMNSVGNQTVTVSYTYSGTTKTTTYSIAVSSVSYRTVMEEGYSTIGTINYTNDVEEISVGTLSTAESGGYSQLDTQYHAWRLGAGSKTGTLTVNSTSTNIRKIAVNAKYYGSDSGTTFTIGGTSNTLTNSYADYTKEYGTATNSVAISSVTNGKRVLIATITVYSYSSQNIGNTEDCIGLESFINNYMHMDYTQNLGYCKDNTHHYYSSAKSAFNALNNHQRSLFVDNSAYATEWARLSAWATANGETINASNQLVQGNNLSISPAIPEKNATIIMLIIVSMIGLSSIGACIYIRRKRAQ